MPGISHFFSKQIILIAFLLLHAIHLSAGSDSTEVIISTHRFSVEDGLASREVFCGIQDDDGFMWFGTRNGLNRYDGKNFKLFTKQKNGLAENRIIQLAKDQHNRLFIVYGHPGYARSAMKIEVMDLKTNKISSLKQAYPDLPFDENYVYWVANGGDDIYFVNSKPFQCWKLSSKGFELKCEMKLWDTENENPQNLETSKGSYHTTTGRACYFLKDYAILFLANDIPVIIITPQGICYSKPNSNRGLIGINPSHEILLTKQEGVEKLNSKGEVISESTTIDLPMQARLRDIHFRRNNTMDLLAYSIQDGLYLYDYHEGRKLFSPNEMKIPSGEGLYGFYKDKQQNYWVFTAAELIKLNIRRNPFKHYFTKAQLHDQSENQVRGIYVNDAHDVFANVWTRLCGIHSVLEINDKYISSNIKYAMCYQQGTFYIGMKTCLMSYELSTNKFKQLIRDDAMSELWVISPSAPNELLIGCSDKIFRYNILTGMITTLQYINDQIPKANFTYRFLHRKDGKIWAIAQNGIYLLNHTADQVIDYFGKQSKDTSHQLPMENLLDAFEDQDGIFWLATNGEGLYRWNKAMHQLQQFNITAGFPSDILYRIEEDMFKNLWISTDNGLVRFNKTTYRVNTYTTSNGLSHNEFNRTSSFKASDGQIYFGGLDGINGFNPADFKGDSVDSKIPLRVISFNQFSGEENKLIDNTDQLVRFNEIVLNPNDKFFNLEFQLLDYSEGKLNYAYMLEGIDKDWNYINENSIRMSGLAAGHYSLRVKGQSPNGQWSQSELRIPVHVMAPFYKRTWVVVCSSLLLLGFIFLLIRWRTKNLIVRKNALEKTVTMRTEQLKNSLAEKDVLLKEIHHRVKNNLQVVISLLDLQQSKYPSDELKKSFLEAKANVQSISLIHENLYRHDNLSGIDMHSFVNDLVKQFNSIYAVSDQRFEFKNSIQQIELDMDTAVPLGLILNELLTNTFKYVFAVQDYTIVTVDIVKTGDEAFEMNYHDNGKGLPPGFDIAKNKTMGIQLMKDLSRQIGGKFLYSYDQGSSFVVQFLSVIGRKKRD